MQLEVFVREIENGQAVGPQPIMWIERETGLLALEQVGLRLEEGKELLAHLQRFVTDRQPAQNTTFRRQCLTCGCKRCLKDYRTRKIDTVFGRAPLRIARLENRCECAPAVAERTLDPRRSTPEFHALRTRLAADFPFRPVQWFLQTTLRLSDEVAPATMAAPDGATGFVRL